MPTLTAPDGTLLVYDMYEAAAPRAAILALHGWADHAGRWRDVGERLCAAGYSTYVLDLRGHGRSGGRRGHLSRFSQLLGDLQAFRRVVRLRTDRPQLLLGTSFGGLVALRYLETQPSDPIAGAVVVSPWLGLAFRPPAWKRFVGRVFADLWPTLPVPARLEADTLGRVRRLRARGRGEPHTAAPAARTGPGGGLICCSGRSPPPGTPPTPAKEAQLGGKRVCAWRQGK